MLERWTFSRKGFSKSWCHHGAGNGLVCPSQVSPAPSSPVHKHSRMHLIMHPEEWTARTATRQNYTQPWRHHFLFHKTSRWHYITRFEAPNMVHFCRDTAAKATTATGATLDDTGAQFKLVLLLSSLVFSRRLNWFYLHWVSSNSIKNYKDGAVSDYKFTLPLILLITVILK